MLTDACRRTVARMSRTPEEELKILLMLGLEETEHRKPSSILREPITGEERLRRKRDYQKEYRKRNREKCREYERKHYRENREVMLERDRIYREKHREQRRETARRHREKNREAIREYDRRYRTENIGRIRERERNYRRKYRQRKAASQ
jgi:hypothetical protein